MAAAAALKFEPCGEESHPIRDTPTVSLAQGVFPSIPNDGPDNTPLREYERYRETIYKLLAGYLMSPIEIDECIAKFTHSLFRCPQVAIAEFNQLYSVFADEMPVDFRNLFRQSIAKLVAHQLHPPAPISILNDKQTSTTNNFQLEIIQEKPEFSQKPFDEVLAEIAQDLHFALNRICGDLQPSSTGAMDSITRQRLAPVEDLILKYINGLIASGVAEMKNMFLAYLDVEEIFHNSDSDIPGLVLHSKRPEYSPDQLLALARSHQALKMKNRLMINLLDVVKAAPELADRSAEFSSVLRRMASLSKVEYSKISHEARQLVLSRRDKSTFLQRTHELIETLWELLETVCAPAPLGGNMASQSPATLGGRAFNPYWLSPTPGSGNFVSSVGSYSSAVFFDRQLPIGQNLGDCSLDLAKYPTDSLIAVLGHHSTKLKKIALHILVMRIFGIRPGKVHDFKVRAKNELWDPLADAEKTPTGAGYNLSHPTDLPTEGLPRGVTPGKFGSHPLSGMVIGVNSQHPTQRKSPFDDYKPLQGEDDQKAQKVNTLVAVWTHDAIYSYEWLAVNCDPLRPDCRPPSAIAVSPAEWAHTDGSITSRIDSNRGSSLASRYVAAGSRLHHMLNAFAGGAEDAVAVACKSQQTTAFLVENCKDFKNRFFACVEELATLQAWMPPPPPAVDGKVLLAVVLDLDGATRHSTGPTPILFQEAINEAHEVLRDLNIALVWVVVLGAEGSSVATAVGRRAQSGSARLEGLDFLPMETSGLKCFYFRNVEVLPRHRGDHPEPSIKECNAAPFEEEALLRHCEMPLFPFLELKRLGNYFITKHPTASSNIHIFEAIPKSEPGPKRFFVRIVTNVNDPLSSEVGLFEQERSFVNGLNALELCLREASKSSTSRLVANHHILMTVVYIPQSLPSREKKNNTASDDLEAMKLTPSRADQVARGLWERYEKRIQKLGATLVELRFKTRGWQTFGHMQGSPSLTEGVYPYRIVLDNPTGQTLRSRRFVEIQNPSTGERVFAALDGGESLSTLILKSSSSAEITATRNDSTGGRPPTTFTLQQTSKETARDPHDYDGRPIDTPHPWAGRLESKRSQAASLQTLYIYDFIDLLEVAVRNLWRRCPKYLFGAGEDRDIVTEPSSSATNARDVETPLLPVATTLVPDRVVEAIELHLNKNGDLVESVRSPGMNECGMVAWRVLLRTPEFPKGRRIIIIANDVTHNMGTFGVQEDLLFQRASELARAQAVPRVYIAVNSGARMGLAQEVQNCFKVEWINSENPTQGFKYLYLSDYDYERLKPLESVVAEQITHAKEGKVWKITDIIGAQIGLGVENLCGSGAIAGETSRAYKDCMTLTYVTGRTVGIGAYLTRLGHRVIQKNNGAPIILTGFQALNRLIGRHVYTSNEELGGVDIMANNGVSHLTVRTDLEGLEALLEWLSFVPEHKMGPLPVMIDPGDPVSRRVEYKPSSSTEDPRLMLTGAVDGQGKWHGGLLDRGSFKEVMANWAKSVIVGRGRLGGIPLGVICVETRVTETLLPADPAMPLTSETKLNRAGQVWFPDSAYKTAQAINDFNNEEIPLVVMANWRGFSGGQRDMFHEVLKFGSMIVDALVDFKQPCFVYIPPKGELRGGAWVVVDPRINPEYIEMFADPDSRGGVLEPSGTVEIKFRDKALRDTALRSDPELQRLMKEDTVLNDAGVPIDDPKRQAIQELLDQRFIFLTPLLKQVASHFADLHDTPVRMRKKRAISDVVAWEKARQFFYWRLRRQLIFFNLRNEAVKNNPKLTLTQAQKLIFKWASESGHNVENSQHFVQWACHSIQYLSRRLHSLRTQYLKETVTDCCKESLTAVADALKLLDPASFNRLMQLVESKNSEGEVRFETSKTMTERQQAAFEQITMPTAHDSP